MTHKISRKGQVQLSETIAVLFIFFVLLVFGIIFYYKYQQVAIKQQGEELLAARAMDTTLRILFLPELFCSQGDAEPEDNCIDVLKLRQVNETIQKHIEDYYFDLFSYSTVTVAQLYPVPRTFVVYDKPKPEYTKRESTYFVVSVRDDTLGSYGYGYVKVEVYS